MIFFLLTKYVMTSSRGEGSEIFFTHILVGYRVNITWTKFHVKRISQSTIMRGQGNPPPPPMGITIKNSPWGIGLVTKTYREIEEEHNSERALQLQLQCHWVQWESYTKNFIWKTILAMPPNLLSFCLGTTYNVLPSPKNLKRWHLASESRCFLCHKDVCTIPHILGACKISLQQGRFTFRHDSVLQHLVLVLKSFLKNLPINVQPKNTTP